MAFARSPFGQFLASGAGRMIRIAAGLLIIVVGLTFVRGPVGAAMAVIGVVPLGAGTLDVCVVSVLLGGPLRGDAIRDLRPAGARR